MKTFSDFCKDTNKANFNSMQTVYEWLNRKISFPKTSSQMSWLLAAAGLPDSGSALTSPCWQSFSAGFLQELRQASHESFAAFVILVFFFFFLFYSDRHDYLLISLPGVWAPPLQIVGKHHILFDKSVQTKPNWSADFPSWTEGVDRPAPWPVNRKCHYEHSTITNTTRAPVEPVVCTGVSMRTVASNASISQVFLLALLDINTI